ncbi:DeoR/GlpR family DNA-binding transcription regulator [Mesobacillus maritimus]|uniref:DeoR/GlpR family DNA-binding transcription regulator n=1 Tax=Mesobacillus maritimus TaxID=1643336 RepID=UPI00203F7076|nr:DeoR/GlpR family DNA-binding transcription regulator [Mesobacillus maritimus]MCM3671900.1 DeoR/GlpR family DNA-binding transcription regulator [Mesobacillus maritimus]
MNNANAGKTAYLLLNERQQGIVDTIETNGSVRVSQLSKEYHVSEETIRRDLEKLEMDGFVNRIHGGAVRKVSHEGMEIPVIKRQETNIKEKEMIAKKAASYVEDGDIIAIDASTTGLQMTKYLKGKMLTVITNSIPVTLGLIQEEDIQVILIGGYAKGHSMSLVGNFAERVIQDYHVDKFFFSCMGVDFRRGVSEAHEAQALVKKQIFNISEKLYLLADHSKFGQKSLVRLCGLKEVDYLVTDKKVSIDKIRELNKLGVKVFVAEE